MDKRSSFNVAFDSLFNMRTTPNNNAWSYKTFSESAHAYNVLYDNNNSRRNVFRNFNSNQNSLKRELDEISRIKREYEYKLHQEKREKRNTSMTERRIRELNEKYLTIISNKI